MYWKINEHFSSAEKEKKSKLDKRHDENRIWSTNT